MSRAIRDASLFLACLAVQAEAQPTYGFASGGRGRFGDPFGFTHHLGDQWLHEDYDEYFQRQPCPNYRSLILSPWRQSANGQMTLSVTLPDIHLRHRDVWLHDDGQSVQIRAIRPVPAQGRACLPDSARTSADGRFEILDRSIALPDEAEGRHAQVRETRRGFDIVVPLRRISQPCAEYRPLAVSQWHQAADSQFKISLTLPNIRPGQRDIWLDKDGRKVQLRAARPMPAQGRACLPKSATISADGRFEILERSITLPVEADHETVRLIETRNGVDILAGSMRPPRSLPNDALRQAQASSVVQQVMEQKPHAALLPFPSDGLEVVEEDWPEVAKHADASEGWWDNRGDFHKYGW